MLPTALQASYLGLDHVKVRKSFKLAKEVRDCNTGLPVEIRSWHTEVSYSEPGTPRLCCQDWNRNSLWSAFCCPWKLMLSPPYQNRGEWRLEAKEWRGKASKPHQKGSGALVQLSADWGIAGIQCKCPFRRRRKGEGESSKQMQKKGISEWKQEKIGVSHTCYWKETTPCSHLWILKDQQPENLNVRQGTIGINLLMHSLCPEQC